MHFDMYDTQGTRTKIYCKAEVLGPSTALNCTNRFSIEIDVEGKL